nr:putative ribonuclease H-like domain-containing protein [Tanacetum cinerariifolium]
PVYDSDGSAEVHDYENCDDNEIFNMFTQEDQYTELVKPIPEPHQVPRNDNNVISKVTSVEQCRKTVEQHPTNVEETHALYDSLYQNLAIEVKKVNTVNHKLKETNADLTTELARYKNQEKCFEISQEKYDKLERCYQQSVYQEQFLSKKINALHLSSGKQIMTLNEEISDLNKQLSKEKSTVSFLLEEKKKLKSDFKIYEDELLDKQIQLEKKIKELNNILVKTGQSIQTIHMLSPKPNTFYHTEQKIALGYQNPFYLKQAQKKQQSLYDGKVLLEKHDPPAVHDSEETLASQIVKDENFPILNQVDARVQNFEIQFLKKAAKFVGDFKSLAKEADVSLAKHKTLELEIERLLRAVVSQDIMYVLQKTSFVDTSNLQTDLQRINNTKTRRPQSRSNTKNDRVPSASKSSQCKNKGAEEKQKKHQPKVKKPKKVGFIARLATPKPSKPRFLLRWSPTGRLFDQKGKVVDSSESESQSDCSNDDNACTSNTLEPKIKQCPNSTSLLGRNDHVAAILGFGDLRWGNILITRVYFVEGLGHNFFLVGQFCDSDLEVANDLVSGLPKFKYHKEHLCPSCEQGKSKRASHPPKPVPNSRQRLHLLHIDLCGPMRIANINGKRITVLLQSPVIIIRTDNSTEFKNQVLKEYFDSVGISHQMSSVRTPQQNGVVERRNRTSVEAARTIIFNRRTKKIIETMNVLFDELSVIGFEQRDSKPGLQSMTSGQISSKLDLTYSPSTITTQQPSEGELDLLFEAMYDYYIGGQPSATARTVPPAQEPQVRQMSMASTSIADTAPTPTNSSSHATNIPITSQD